MIINLGSQSQLLACGTLVLSHSLMPHLGILGVGVGWLGSQTLVALAVSFEFRKRLRVVG